jgi:hypothetical protein
VETSREQKARDELARILEECGQLADGVRYFEGQELIDLLDTIDSYRALLADNSTTLRSAVSY